MGTSIVRKLHDGSTGEPGVPELILPVIGVGFVFLCLMREISRVDGVVVEVGNPCSMCKPLASMLLVYINVRSVKQFEEVIKGVVKRSPEYRCETLNDRTRTGESQEIINRERGSISPYINKATMIPTEVHRAEPK